MGTQNWEVERRLSNLGLSPVILWEAAKAGYDSFSESSANAPPAGKGIVIWSNIIGRLRDSLIPEGWTKCDKGFFPTLAHLESAMAIVVMAGDDDTGLKDGNPKSRSPKGVSMRQAIEVNKHFSSLWQNPAWVDVMGFTESPVRTWVLMHNAGPKLSSFDEVRIEFSLPVGVTDGHVSAWDERILVPRPNEMQDSNKGITPRIVASGNGTDDQVGTKINEQVRRIQPI